MAVGDSVGVAAPVSLASWPSPPEMLASCGAPVCGADAAGPVGAVTPAGPSTVLLRSLLTRRTVMNLESCSFRWAAEQDCSSPKFAKAQLLLEIRNSDSSPSVSLHTWCTRLIRPVCGGRLPIQMACPSRGRCQLSVPGHTPAGDGAYRSAVASSAAL